MGKAYKEPTLLTDKNHIIVLEAIIGATNAVIPDSLEPFEVLVSNTPDGVAKRYLSTVKTDGSHVAIKMGDSPHPMSEEHSISLVCLLTQVGEVICVYLSPNCEPVTHFTVERGDAPAAAYTYCNLHGFRRTGA